MKIIGEKIYTKDGKYLGKAKDVTDGGSLVVKKGWFDAEEFLIDFDFVVGDVILYQKTMKEVKGKVAEKLRNKRNKKIEGEDSGG